MKKSIILVAMILMSASIRAQTLKESDVPAAVKATFMKKFPNGKNVKWSKENEKEFEAEFKNGSLEQAANFEGSGKWLVTETEIKKTDLPQAVQAAIKKEFDGYKLEEVEKAETPDKGTFYEVELEKGEKSYSVQFSSEGKILKKEEKSEEKEEKDN